MDRPPRLLIDLNETPSLSPCDTPPSVSPRPLPPAAASPPRSQPTLPLDAYALVRGCHPAAGRRARRPRANPWEDGAGQAPPPCASCGLPEIPGATLVCDACERGFHVTCVRVWPPPPPPPQQPGPSVAPRPPVAGSEDWICPQCEMHGKCTKRWKLGPVRTLDINAAPPTEDACTSTAVAALEAPSRINIADLAPLGGFMRQLPHFEGLHLKSSTPYDGKQFMPALDIVHSLRMRSNSSSIDRDVITDGNISHRSVPLCKRQQDLPSMSSLGKVADNQEIARASIFMDPSLLVEATERNSTENRSFVRPPKYLAENSNRRKQRSNAVLPVQYGDFYITSLGEIDQRASYHNCLQILPVGFTSCWHDRITGSLFECEVCDGGNFGPTFKVRRLPCSVFPLPNASTVLFHNSVRKDTIETKGSSSLIADTADDSDDNVVMLLNDPSETELDFFSCLRNNLEGKCNSILHNDVQTSSMTTPTPSLHSPTFSCTLKSQAGMHDEIGEFSFEGTSPSSVWRMISCALVEACQKVYNQDGHLVFFCTHDTEKHSVTSGNGQDYYDPCSPLSRFYSSFGPRIPRFVEKESDVQSTYILLKEWLNQDRIGLDMEFVQELIESLRKSKACSNYQFLRYRTKFLTSLTVASGYLSAVHKNGKNDEVMSYGLYGSTVTKAQAHVEGSSCGIRELPPANTISSKLPPDLAGEVFQIWEFLCRFGEIFGLKEIPSYEELEEELIDPWPICINQREKLLKEIQPCRGRTSPMDDTANVSLSYSNDESGLTSNEEIVFTFIPVETSSVQEIAQAKLAAQTVGRCSGVVLPMIHQMILRVLFGEVLSKVAIFVDPNIDPRESKPKRGRKRDTENSNSTKDLKIDMLIANELTWPELARRYVLAVSSLIGFIDLSDISSREGVKLFRCLQGDGGVLCGAVPGIDGMEKDALLLLEAENWICNSSMNKGSKVFQMDYKDTGTVDSPEAPSGDAKTLPDWAKHLEPVRKLPTNVGTRIRKCVYEALEQKPPEWARKILEHSISKGVYKGNASGPTKKAVLSVLAEVSRFNVPQNLDRPRKERTIISIPDAILKKCRIILRCVISSDETKLFGNLLGTTLMNNNENEDEGMLGFPGMVSRPLDFRTIDVRVSMGAYCGSWEAFHEDVQEVIHNLHTAFSDQPDVVEAVKTLSQSFESLYQTEVLELVQRLDSYTSDENVGSKIHKELHDILTAANNIPKAPWEDGICKVCGIDRDDDSVLLCDKCDSEYHTYCLNPPLARIPEGNWYCPSCISGQKKAHLQGAKHLNQQQNEDIEKVTDAFRDELNDLAKAMELKEYWELTVKERVYLLRFLCDELLKTALIREHLDQCSDKSIDLQQKLRALNFEWRDLKYKEELFTIKSAKENAENQQQRVSIASDCLEEAGQSNVGMNSHQLTEGTVVEQSNVWRPQGSDGEISEGDKSLKCSERASMLSTHQTDGATISEPLQSCGQGELQEKLSSAKSSPCDNLTLTDSHGAEITPVTSVVSTSSGKLPEQNARASFQESIKTSNPILIEEAANSEMNTLLNETSKLQDSINTLESQITMTSLKREFLGRDSLGRLYWAIGRPGKHPWLVADGSMLIPKKKNICMVNWYPQSAWKYRGWNSSSFVIYESDQEIRCVIGWLKDNDPMERELKDCLSLWQRLVFHQENFPRNGPQLSKFSTNEQFMKLPNTKAAVVLEQKYGQLDPDILPKKRGKKLKLSSEGRTYHCYCLEPIWSSRQHCLSCHQTYITSTEFEGHNGGKCNASNGAPDESKENDEKKVRGSWSENKEKDPRDKSGANEVSGERKLDACPKLNLGRKLYPYDLEEISRKFITNDSSKEIVKDIGLIGSNGVPSFVPSPTFFLDPVTVLIHNKNSGKLPGNWVSSLDECKAMSDPKFGQETSKSGQNCPGNFGDELVIKSNRPSLDGSFGKEASSATNKLTRLVSSGSIVPESSLIPLVGRNSHILKHLKMILLDIDAALPEEALRPSKSQQIRRCSWRAFVKDAVSICQMVLATNLLESMIKTEFLKSGWWYWSSFTAAIKTPTVSSLALRIYTLDDCIIYIKGSLPNMEPADNVKHANKGKKRKEPESSGT